MGMYLYVHLLSLASFHSQADGKDGRPFHLTVAKLEEGLKRAEQEVMHECVFS